MARQGYRARPTADRPGQLRSWVRSLGRQLARLVRWLVGVVLEKSAAAPGPLPRAAHAPFPSSEVGLAKLPKVPPPLEPPPGHVQHLGPAMVESLPYRRRAHLLTKGERAVWHPLYHAVKGRYRLFCKVALTDVVSAPGRRWFNRIRGYHVDFLLCDPTTTAPLLVVELDDRSHRSPRALQRDRFKDEVLAAAGIPILRVRAQQAYAPVELREAIDRRLGAHP